MAQEETVFTPEQAREAQELIDAMRQAVSEVPSYVEVNATKAWLENHQKTQDAA